MKDLAESLKENKFIRELYLHKCSIDSIGMEVLIHNLPSGINVVDISNNGTKDSNKLAVELMLSLNDNIEKLFIDNPLNDIYFAHFNYDRLTVRNKDDEEYFWE